MIGSVALQWIVVGAVVAGSLVYAAWTLMPTALRRSVAAAAVRLPLPEALTRRLRAEATAASSCGCSGCDRNAQPGSARTPAATRPITLHRRIPH